jgi:hypothetical protein
MTNQQVKSEPKKRVNIVSLQLELSNQVQHFIKEDFIRCFPT